MPYFLEQDIPRKTSAYSIIQSTIVYSCNSGPFRNRMRFSIMGYQNIVSFIYALFYSCSPMAIAWFIVAQIIDTIYSFALRSFSHIFKKVSKAIFPSIANSNTSISIINKLLGINTVTSVSHSLPRSISSLAFILCPISMSSSFFNAITSTRTGPAVQELISSNASCISTFTKAVPFSTAIRSIFGARNNCPPVEFLSSKINNFHASIIAKTLSLGGTKPCLQ